MLRKRTWILLLLVFGLRLLLQGWDAGVAPSTLHPDERQVGFVTERMDGWFADPNFYAYGSLHFQAVRLTAAAAGLGDSLRGLVVSGRALSLAASMLAIILGWILAHHAWGRRTGEVFLLLVAWVPLDLQQSHFCTVEAHHTAWIMLALAACYWLASGGRVPAAAAAGAAVGASLAVKVASLALGLPLAVALILAGRRLGFAETFRLAAIAVTAGIATFWVCQPWAIVDGRPPLGVLTTAAVLLAALHFGSRTGRPARYFLFGVAGLAAMILSLQAATLLGIGQGTVVARLGNSVLAGQFLNPAYLRGVGEQVAMVMGRADLPYVRVYAATLPVLYPLRELALWGLGPMLLLAVFAGAVNGTRVAALRWRRWMAGRWNRGSALLLIMLAWLLPMAIRLGTLQVKYLRYWEPLVVPAVLIAAWWLARLGARLRHRTLIVVAAGTVIWGLAYLWAFTDPHPHGVASRWLAPMLSDGQVVAFENWDESIALVPVDGHVERINLPSYDLPDDDEKVLRWCEELARADWVVLTSNRVFRTVLANPDRFPQTARLYRLLLAGEAGFEPVTRAHRGPRIFALRWPVQTADESFVNYDFPQVVIFRRSAEIKPSDLAERVRRPIPHLAGLGFRDLSRLYLAQLPAIPAVPTLGRQAVDLGVWLFVFLGLGLTAWVILLPILRSLPDTGIGLSLATGWIAPAWLMWLGSELGIWNTGPVTATWLFIGLCSAGAFVFFRRRHELRLLVRRRKRFIVTVVAVFAAMGALFLVVRAWNPAIFWGEKPMDFSFLNAFVRAEHWPTGEPWMAGMPLHYYYFGEVLSSFPILLTGCTAAVGYNLMSATIPALSAAILAGFGLLLAPRRRVFASLVLPVLVLLTGNLAWPWLLDLAKQGKFFDLWWATSRVIPGFAIDEYPLWTTLFADLHGHFIALPVMLAALMWGWVVVHTTNRNWMVAAAMCGIGTAVLVATNPWDIFILTAALGTGVFVAARRPLAAIFRLCAAAVISLVAAAPFIIELTAGISAGAGQRGLFLTEADFAPAWAVARHFGLFLIPLGVLALAKLGRRSWLALPTAGIGIFAGLSFGSTAAALGLATAALFATVAVSSRSRLARFGWSMATLGMAAVAVCERFTLIDRMNTIFKVYNGVWVVLAIALGVALLRTVGRQRRLLFIVWVPLQLAAMVNLPLGVAQGWMQPRLASPRPSLDGQAYLASQDPQTWFLARALQGAARPDETIAEAEGPSYGKFTRIAMHTGQPTVLGWHYHLMQRGQTQLEISNRSKDLENLFSGQDQHARRAVLDRYQVRWLVVGDLERERYALTGEDPLVGVPGLLHFAEHEGATLYRVLAPDQAARSVISPKLTLPRGTTILGELPQPRRQVIRSIDLDEFGATIVDRDGAIIDLDLRMVERTVLPGPSCEVSSLARYGGDKWVSCADGSVWQLSDGRWLARGRMNGASHLAADQVLWGWGEEGLWQFAEGRWRKKHSGAVTAAAARGTWIAWSEGNSVLVGRGETPRIVSGPLDGVRLLGWAGTALIAIDSQGIHRSGGGILPWRQALHGVDSIVAITGNQDGLWLVREDGLVLDSPTPRCASPWKPEQTRPGENLREPRGLAASPLGWFVAADALNHRIVWYSEPGVCIDQMGSEGTIPGAFREPSGLALAPDGTLAITDTWNGRVQLLRPDGSTQIVGKNLFGPRAALWMADGSLLVSDTGNKRVLRFSPPDWQEEVAVALPKPVVGLASAAGLLAAAVPSDGIIALVDLAEGEVVRRIEVPGWSSLEQQEGYLALLPSGDLVASAPKPGELWRVDPTGSKPPHLLRNDLPGVTGLTLLPDGQLLAALTWEHRLVKVDLEN